MSFANGLISNTVGVGVQRGREEKSEEGKKVTSNKVGEPGELCKKGD